MVGIYRDFGLQEEVKHGLELHIYVYIVLRMQYYQYVHIMQYNILVIVLTHSLCPYVTACICSSVQRIHLR